MAGRENWKPATDAENAYFAELEAREEAEELEAEAADDAYVAAENAYFEELEAAEDEDDEDDYRLRAYSEMRGF